MKLDRYMRSNFDWQARHLGVESDHKPTAADIETMLQSRQLPKTFKANLLKVAQWAFRETHRTG